MNRKVAMVATVIVAVVVIAAVAGQLVATYAQGSGNNMASKTSIAPNAWIPLKGYKAMCKAGFKAPLICIEVSPEYNSTVMSILEANPETKQLLDQGYSVAWIRPILKVYIGAGGDVTLKATQATVALTNKTAVYVYLVDIVDKTVTLLAYYKVPAPGSSLGCGFIRG